MARKRLASASSSQSRCLGNLRGLQMPCFAVFGAPQGSKCLVLQCLGTSGSSLSSGLLPKTTHHFVSEKGGSSHPSTFRAPGFRGRRWGPRFEKVQPVDTYVSLIPH
eukprot:746865-Amphidinium_carterae.1